MNVLDADKLERRHKLYQNIRMDRENLADLVQTRMANQSVALRPLLGKYAHASTFREEVLQTGQ